MHKFFRNVYFLMKFSQEKSFRVTQPLKFSVEKSCHDMYIIALKFEKLSYIIIKDSICVYLTQKIANLSSYKSDISKIIFTCIKNCHHYMNHYWWNVQIWFSTLSFSRGHYGLRRSRISVADFEGLLIKGFW